MTQGQMGTLIIALFFLIVGVLWLLRNIKKGAGPDYDFVHDLFSTITGGGSVRTPSFLSPILIIIAGLVFLILAFV